jgi:hypothetical protein
LQRDEEPAAGGSEERLGPVVLDAPDHAKQASGGLEFVIRGAEKGGHGVVGVHIEVAQDVVGLGQGVVLHRARRRIALRGPEQPEGAVAPVVEYLEHRLVLGPVPEGRDRRDKKTHGSLRHLGVEALADVQVGRNVRGEAAQRRSPDLVDAIPGEHAGYRRKRLQPLRYGCQHAEGAAVRFGTAPLLEALGLEPEPLFLLVLEELVAVHRDVGVVFIEEVVDLLLGHLLIQCLVVALVDDERPFGVDLRPGRSRLAGRRLRKLLLLLLFGLELLPFCAHRVEEVPGASYPSR